MALCVAAAQSRRVALRPFVAVRTAMTWDTLLRKADANPEAKAEVTSLKNKFDQMEKDYQAASKPVAPINWDKYKQEIEVPQFVDYLKEKYESIDWSKFEVKTPESQLAKIRDEQEKMLREAEELRAKAEETIAELQRKLEMAMSQRTNRDTTVEQVWARYPQIKEEVEKEIANHEWFKDVK